MKKIIGIIGPIGSGKDTAANYLSKRLNIPAFQISAPLKMISAERGIEPTRQNLIALGTSLANEKSEAYLAEYLLGQVTEAGIITGMRQLAQIECLRKHSSLVLISIDADSAIRFKRAMINKKLGEAETLTEFVDRERAENSAPNVQRLFECMKLADIFVANDGSFEELYDEIENKVVSIAEEDIK